jgi:hypothetical protein
VRSSQRPHQLAGPIEQPGLRDTERLDLLAQLGLRSGPAPFEVCDARIETLEALRDRRDELTHAPARLRGLLAETLGSEVDQVLAAARKRVVARLLDVAMELIERLAQERQLGVVRRRARGVLGAKRGRVAQRVLMASLS